MPECDQSDSLATRRKGCLLARACCSVVGKPTVMEVLSVATAQEDRLRETFPQVRGVQMCADSPQ